MAQRRRELGAGQRSRRLARAASPASRAAETAASATPNAPARQLPLTNPPNRTCQAPNRNAPTIAAAIVPPMTIPARRPRPPDAQVTARRSRTSARDARTVLTGRSRGDGEAPLVDGAHRDEESLALLADPVLDRHDHVVEGDEPGVPGPDPQLAVERPGRQAGHPPLQHEGGHPSVLPAPVNCREEQEVIREIGQADPDLRAVEDIRVAVAAGGGPEAGAG